MTRLDPDERFGRTDWFLEGMDYADDEFLKRYGIEFPCVGGSSVPEFIPVEGRTLDPPILEICVGFI